MLLCKYKFSYRWSWKLMIIYPWSRFCNASTECGNSKCVYVCIYKWMWRNIASKNSFWLKYNWFFSQIVKVADQNWISNELGLNRLKTEFRDSQSATTSLVPSVIALGSPSSCHRPEYVMWDRYLIDIRGCLYACNLYLANIIFKWLFKIRTPGFIDSI